MKKILLLLMLAIIFILPQAHAIFGSTTIDYTHDMADITLVDNTNEMAIQMRWNISVLPDGIQNMHSAMLCIYDVTRINSGALSPTSIWQVLDLTWTEASNLSALNNQTVIALDNRSFNSSSVYTYRCLNITSLVSQTYENLTVNDIFSIRFTTSNKYFDSPGILLSDAFLGLGDTDNHWDTFEDRENNQASGFRPYIYVTYDFLNATTISILSPTEGQNITANDISVTWDYAGNVTNCTYSLDAGLPINITYPSFNILNISTGNHTLEITCKDLTYGGVNVSSPMRNFSTALPCTENWAVMYNDCVDNQMFVTYIDLNACGTFVNFTSLVPANGTYVDCAGELFKEGQYAIQYKRYPFFLVQDNPQYIFIELSDLNGTLTIIPNLTIEFTDDIGVQYNFTPTKNTNLTRYELYLNFTVADVGTNFTLFYYTDMAGFGTANGVMYIRNQTCTVLVRLWEDKDQDTIYDNDFGYVLARGGSAMPRYNLYDYITFIPTYDKYFKKSINTVVDTWGVDNGTLVYTLEESEFPWFHAEYADGIANLTLYDPDDYELRFIDGTFVFPLEYGKYYSSLKGIDTGLGTYRMNCNPNVIEVHDFYVSQFDVDFRDTWMQIGWISFFIFISGLAGFITFYVTGSIRMGGIVFLAFLAMCLSVFMGVNLFNIMVKVI